MALRLLLCALLGHAEPDMGWWSDEGDGLYARRCSRCKAWYLFSEAHPGFYDR